jgi:hypothetical protein
MRNRLWIITTAILVFSYACPVAAQDNGQAAGGRAQRGVRISRLLLLKIQAVQQELKLTAEQMSQLDKVAEQLREQRVKPLRSEDLQLLTPEARQTVVQEQLQKVSAFEEKEKDLLGGVLAPDQLQRLDQILIQVLGPSALQTARVSEALGLTDEQKQSIASTQRAALQEIRAQIQALGPAADRAAMAKKVSALRQKMDNDVMAHLSSEQKEKFITLKGPAFEMPPGSLRSLEAGPEARGDAGAGATPPPQQAPPKPAAKRAPPGAIGPSDS